MNMYLVTLDPSKCVSYTLPDGRKFLPGRSKVISEEDVGVFQSAGVFLVSQQPSSVRSSEKSSDGDEDGKKIRFKKRKVSSPEINPDDKLDVEEDKKDFV